MARSVPALAFLFLLAAPGASAQVSVGVTAGLNVASWQVGGFNELESPRTRFVGGLTARAGTARLLGLQADLLYTQKGSQLDDGSIRYAADYVELPVLVRLVPPLGVPLAVGVSLGVAPALPVRGRVDYDAFEDEPAGSEEIDLQTDVGLVVGADVGSGPFEVGLRYTYGLRNVIAEPESPNETAVRTRNQVISVTGAYRFGR